MADLSQVKEHMTVIGADGVRVGTVDKVEGDRIKLTKDSSPAGPIPAIIIISPAASSPRSRAIASASRPTATSPCCSRKNRPAARS
jgi:hypothetical protein